MTIAFYAPLKPPTHPVPSGDRRMARLLMAALHQAGFQVDLCSRFRSFDGRGDPDRQSRIAALADRMIPRLVQRLQHLPPSRRPVAWFTYHLYHKAPDWFGPRIAQTLGIPYLVAEASHAPKQAGGPWDIGYQSAAAAIPVADRIFSFTARDSAGLESLVPANKLVPLAPFLNVHNLQTPARAAARHQLAAQYGLPGDEPWLLAVGMFRHGDKLDSYKVLAAALSHILERPWQLLIVGDGVARDEVRHIFAPMDVRIRFLGQQDEAALAQIYASVDLMVWPAIREAYGMTLLEAQAAGVPVVAGAGTGVDAVVASGQGGIIVPATGADLVAGLATATAELLDDPVHRMTLAKSARDRVRQHHDLPIAAAVLRKNLADLGVVPLRGISS